MAVTPNRDRAAAALVQMAESANANHRFRVPLLPLLAIPVGPFLVGARARDRRVLRMVGAALCLLVFASVVGTWALRPDLRPTAPAAD